jgi:aspartyl-tRNA(Asn)/glutamyl-tRNA(Gln) amidotransferase subunit A
MSSKPLAGKKLAIVKQTMGAGIADDVSAAVTAAAQHLESLGATIEEVRWQDLFYQSPAPLLLL